MSVAFLKKKNQDLEDKIFVSPLWTKTSMSILLEIMHTHKGRFLSNGQQSLNDNQSMRISSHISKTILMAFVTRGVPTNPHSCENNWSGAIQKPTFFRTKVEPK